MPIQEEQIKRQQHEEQQHTWSQAEKKCRESTQTVPTVLKDSSGMIYCLSQSGRLITTITERLR